MRGFTWTCTALVAILCIMSLNLWRELRTERAAAGTLRTQIAQVMAGGVARPAAVTREDQRSDQ